MGGKWFFIIQGNKRKQLSGWYRRWKSTNPSYLTLACVNNLFCPAGIPLLVMFYLTEVKMYFPFMDISNLNIIEGWSNVQQAHEPFFIELCFLRSFVLRDHWVLKKEVYKYFRGRLCTQTSFIMAVLLTHQFMGQDPVYKQHSKWYSFGILDRVP